MLLRRLLHIHRWTRVDKRVIEGPAGRVSEYVTVLEKGTYAVGEGGEILRRGVLTTYVCRCGKGRFTYVNAVPKFRKDSLL
jgi:hypothetical protein